MARGGPGLVCGGSKRKLRDEETREKGRVERGMSVERESFLGAKTTQVQLLSSDRKCHQMAVSINWGSLFWVSL